MSVEVRDGDDAYSVCLRPLVDGQQAINQNDVALKNYKACWIIVRCLKKCRDGGIPLQKSLRPDEDVCATPEFGVWSW